MPVGLPFVPSTPANPASLAIMSVHALAFDKPARPAWDDSALRAAIVKVATYYLRLAQTRSPAEMEAMIWGTDSINGVDHGESCAAFASLTLALAAQATGQQSWVTGGSTYPWPLHQWADVRVDPNPDSPGIISVLQDAQAHNRWHPLGDGYVPQPGDWVLFDGDVEVITSYSNGVLSTIGGDSGPNLSVNAHTFSGPLAAQGVTGFVDNGELVSAVSPASAGGATGASGAAAQGQAAVPGTGGAAVPGTGTAAVRKGTTRMVGAAGRSRTAVRPRASRAPRASQGQQAGTAAIPGLQPLVDNRAAVSGPYGTPSYARNNPPAAANRVPSTSTKLAFISQVAPGAMDAQSRYGIPAAVTIAQAIDESGWGQSVLAIKDHNLFGIKGTGPAGCDVLPTQEFQYGQWVTVSAAFRVYHNVAESIADHSQLLSTGRAYQYAMTDRYSPDAFANDLTGVYSTDPNYGAYLISLMRLYNLYRYDMSTSHAATQAGTEPAKGAGQYAQSASDQASCGQKRTSDNTQSRPQPPQSTGEDWRQFTLTMFGIPIVVNLFSSAVYERLRRPSRQEQLTKFKLRVTAHDGSIVEVFLPDDGEAWREVIMMFQWLAGPGKVYKQDDGTGDWKLFLVFPRYKLVVSWLLRQRGRYN
jgi:flagellum-specific peptidoglycan hydrolase FlgJ